MFKKLKIKLQERIEKNAIKIPNATYKDMKGNVTSEDIVLKRSTFPLIGDWGRIYPPLNEDGNINWINTIIGGKRNLIKLLMIIGLLFMLYLWVSGVLGASREYMDGNKYIIVEKSLFTQYCNGFGMNAHSSFNENLNITMYLDNKTIGD